MSDFLTDPYALTARNPFLVTPGRPNAFTPGSWDSLAAISGPTGEGFSGTGAPGQPFQWQNPYAYQAWGAGLDPTAGFGEKLGSYLGGNAPLFLSGLQTLSGVMGAYTGLQGVQAAKAALRQQKKEFNINLTNQTKAYNTEVGDRVAGRSYATEAERQAALAAAQLVDRSKYGKGG